MAGEEEAARWKRLRFSLIASRTIGSADNRVTMRIVPTDEELMIAKDTLAIVQPNFGVCTQ